MRHPETTFGGTFLTETDYRDPAVIKLIEAKGWIVWPPIPFRTKCELLVELGREHAKACSGKALGAFDGGFALGNVVRPLVRPDDPSQPRMDILTRLRRDARLHALPPGGRRQPARTGCE